MPSIQEKPRSSSNTVPPHTSAHQAACAWALAASVGVDDHLVDPRRRGDGEAVPDEGAQLPALWIGELPTTGDRTPRRAPPWTPPSASTGSTEATSMSRCTRCFTVRGSGTAFTQIVCSGVAPRSAASPSSCSSILQPSSSPQNPAMRCASEASMHRSFHRAIGAIRPDPRGGRSRQRPSLVSSPRAWSSQAATMPPIAPKRWPCQDTPGAGSRPQSAPPYRKNTSTPPSR